MENTVRYLRPLRSGDSADRSLDTVKAQLEELVRQRSTLPSEQLSSELQMLMDVLIQEGRRLGWDAERALLLARTAGPDDKG